MKTCTKCKETKPLEEYHKQKRAKSGRRSVCKLCRSIETKEYHQKNREKNLSRSKEWVKKNREKVREHKRNWYNKNREVEGERKRKRYRENLEGSRAQRRNYRQNNLEKVKVWARKWQKKNLAKSAAACAKRRAKKLNATPHWLTEQDHKYIQALYRKAQELTKQTGIQHHVDHIHPLQGENICGLHVPENLQILTAEENLRKSNSH